MLQCPKCKKGYDENYAFCEECGVKLVESEVRPSPQPKSLVFDRIERSVFFRFTRSYTWLILILSILGFMGAIIYLIPDISLLIKKDTKVFHEEIKILLASKKTGKSPPEEEMSGKKINPELLAKLDKEIYEIIFLLPKDIQDKMGVEKIRSWVKDRTRRYDGIKEKIKILQEAKSILLKFNEPERGEALSTFFDIKAGKENAITARQTEIRLKLATIGGSFFALIMTIAAFSLILVLLAIERNTRKG